MSPARAVAASLATGFALAATAVSCGGGESDVVVSTDAGAADTSRATGADAASDVAPDVESDQHIDTTDAGDADPEDVRPAAIPWVDPARCVSPCGHPDETHLVTIDAQGALSTPGIGQIAEDAQPALVNLLLSATDAGYAITAGSSYRTYASQAELYAQYHVTEPGRSARPGHSEHELGLAVDLGIPDAAAAAFLAEHAFEHGWLLSYPQGKEKQTGFRYEYWHVRYVGLALAAEVTSSGLTLEEWLHAHPDRGVSGDCSDCTDPASRSDCAAVTPAGACESSVLAWCFDGAEARVDCAASSLSCRVTGDAASCAP